MEVDTSLVEQLVLHALGRDADLGPESAYTLEAVARRSGIKWHEVARVLDGLENRTPPLVRRAVDEHGLSMWQLGPGAAAPPVGV